MMTREDILRELELLPVWQLRSPIAEKSGLPSSNVSVEANLSVEPKQEMLTQPEIASTNEASKTEIVEPTTAVTEPTAELTSFRYFTCENDQWLFVMAALELTAEQQHLLANIFKAMQLKVKPVAVTKNIVEVVTKVKPKILISMGESVTQALLRSEETLDSLRQKSQLFEGATLIATYDTAHLLNNLSDKANAWADLRTAMRYMQDLNS